MFRLTLILNCAFLGVLGATFGPKCILDRACSTKKINDIYKSILEDQKNQIDPLYAERVDVNLGTFQYSLMDLTTTGFKLCSVKDSKLDLDTLKAEVILYCPKFHAVGKYDAHGILIGMPVEGNGEFTIDTKEYSFKISLDVSLTTKDDKHYLHIDDFNVEATALGNLVYDFKNLFNGQMELGDKFLKYVNENSKAVAKEVQGPLFRNKFEKIVDDVNEFLKKEPLETFLIL